MIQDELNVQTVALATDTTQFVNYSAKPNFKVLGRRLGKEVQTLATVLAEVDEQVLARAVLALEPLVVMLNGAPINLELGELDIRVQEKEGFSAESSGGLTVIMDLHLTEELLALGHVRELISKLQGMRKEAGFAVEDKIIIYWEVDAVLARAIAGNESYIQDEVLAIAMTASPEGEFFMQAGDINGHAIILGVKKA
ncbi:MAG: Isoleucine--tRNA ligase [Firmicutes bacterium]|nr:Isoleucine--tRNA ligase [Bacillota bacterium]